MESTLKELAVSLFDIDAVKFGDFTTKVGLKTPIYIDLRVIIAHPQILEKIATTLWRLATNSLNSAQICGVPYTALPIATVISVKENIPMLIKRKEAKAYGTKKLIEGKYKEGDSCVIIEDVVTSGSSILETVKDLKNEGLKVTEALVIVDRQQGGRRNLEENGIKMNSLYTLTQLVEYLRDADRVNDETVKKVADYLKNCAAPVKTIDDDPVKSRLKLSFTTRASHSKNPLAAKLFQLMDDKETNLCLAADLTQSNDIIELGEIAGPHIAVLKIHVDIIEDFNETFIKRLKYLASKHKFYIMEDRKFGDIGNTVAHQYSKGVYKISEWADFVTAHSVAGPGILDGLQRALKYLHEERGVFLITEMSSKGTLTRDNYIKESVDLSKDSKLLAGHVSQSNVFSDPGLIQLTPGVKLARSSDDLGQQYNTPEAVVNAGADLAVVGRGITESSNKLSAILEYKKQLWAAYRNRIS